jgi:hypothetical protein
MPVSIARDAGLPSEIVDRGRIRELWPSVVVDDLVGGVYFPADGTINPGSAALALARAAVDRGVRYVPGTAVTGFRRAADGRHDVRGRRRGGGRRARRGPVDVGVGPARRCERRPLPGRARVGHDRRHAGRDGGPAVPARPRWLPLHPPSRRSVRDRCLRAEREAMGSIGRADRRVRRARPGLVAFRPGVTGRPGACPGPGRDRVRALPARPGELHARCQPPARVRARGAGAVRRCRAELAGDHLRARRRARRRRVDRRRVHDDGSRRGRCRPDGSMGEPAPLVARADRRVAGWSLRDALAEQAARDGARLAAVAAGSGLPGGRRRDGPGRRLGAAVMVRRSATHTPTRRGSRPFATRSARPARGSPCTTSRRTRSSRSRGRARWTACSGW